MIADKKHPQTGITSVEMNSNGKKQAETILIKCNNSKVDLIALLISALSFLLSFFSLIYSLRSQTNDFGEIYLRELTSETNKISYVNTVSSSERVSNGNYDIVYPLILANRSDHKISIINYQVTRIIDDREIYYPNHTTLLRTQEEQEIIQLPIVIDSGEAMAVDVRINTLVAGFTSSEIYKESYSNQDMTLEDLVRFYEKNNKAFPQYKIKFITARGNAIEYTLILTSDMFN